MRERWDRSRKKAGEISDYSLGSKMTQFLRNLFVGSGDFIASSDLEEEDSGGLENSGGGEEYKKLLVPSKTTEKSYIEPEKSYIEKSIENLLNKDEIRAGNIRKRIMDILNTKNPDTKAIVNEILSAYWKSGEKPPKQLVLFREMKDVPVEVLVSHYRQLLNRLAERKNKLKEFQNEYR
jgi:hypothetical protein